MQKGLAREYLRSKSISINAPTAIQSSGSEQNVPKGGGVGNGRWAISIDRI